MSCEKKSGFGKFIAGVAIGVGLGVLFAPKKGSETRADLKKKLDDLVNKIKDIDADEVKEAFEEKVAEIKEQLADLDKEKVLKVAKEKGKAIKRKCQDLVNLAVAKGTPVLEKAAEDVRVKTIAVIKDVLAKLEKKDEAKEEKK